MDSLNIHDLWTSGFHLAALTVAVLVLKRDMKWLKEAFGKHEALDDSRFDKVDADIRELRDLRKGHLR